MKNNKVEDSNDELVKTLIKQKEELEHEFTEILKFIVEDLKNQEELTQNLLKNNQYSDPLANEYQKKYNVLLEENKQLKKSLGNLTKKYKNLSNSKLGKLQIKYWAFKKK